MDWCTKQEISKNHLLISSSDEEFNCIFLPSRNDNIFPFSKFQQTKQEQDKNFFSRW